MSQQATQLIDSRELRQLSDNPSPKLRLVAAILVAVILVLGIYGIESNDSSNGFVNAQTQGICDRTTEVQAKIIEGISGNPTCDVVTDAQLNAYTGSRGKLLLGNKGINNLQAGDFAGLTSVREIHINNNNLTELPGGIFDGLTSLEDLKVQSNKLTVVAQDVFSDLADSPNLDAVYLENNDINTIESGAFSGVAFSSTHFSRRLWLHGNELATLQDGAFDGATNLIWLRLEDNQISSIVDSAFDDLVALGQLDLANNQLVTLPSGLLEHTAPLHRLELQNNKLMSLEADVFRTLASLATLYLDDNELTMLSSDVFKIVDPMDNTALIGNPTLRTLYLQNNQLSSLPDGIFAGLPTLEILDLRDNELSDLPAELLPLLRICSLAEFRVGGNSFTAAPTETVVDGMTTTTYGLFDAFTTTPACTDNGITILDVSDVPLTTANLEAIRDNHSGITRLYIANTGGAAATVLDLFENLSLKFFDTSGNDLSSWTSTEVTKFVTAVASEATLQYLWLANTQITASNALAILAGLRTSHDTIDFSDNDLSDWNTAANRTSLGTALAPMTALDLLFMDNTQIDGDTALTIMENIEDSILTVSLSGNDLSGWNAATSASSLAAAFERIAGTFWTLVDLSNTGIDDTAASSIVPKLKRTYVSWRLDPAKLDLSDNKLTKFESAWLVDWTFLTELDLSNNSITSTAPATYATLADYLQILRLIGNPLDTTPVEQDYYDALPNLKLFTFDTSVVSPGLVFTDAPVTITETGSVTQVGSSATNVTAEYKVELATEPTADVTLTLAFATGSDSDITFKDASDNLVTTLSLTFTTTNWDDEQTVTVNAASDDDALDDTATITHTASGGDYGSVTGDVSVTVTDDEEARVIVPERFTLEETQTVDYTVALSANPSAPVTVTPMIATGADAIEFVNLGAVTLDSDNWNTGVVVEIEATDDEDGEDAMASITHSVTGAAEFLPQDGKTLAITVIDDDEKGLFFELSHFFDAPTQTIRTVESDSFITYRIKLKTKPAGDVEVTPQLSPNARIVFEESDPTITFTVDDWDQLQFVDMNHTDDPDAQDNRYSITHTISGYGTLEASELPEPIIIWSVDDDEADVQVTIETADQDGDGNLLVEEGDAAGTEFKVVLTSLPVILDGSNATATLTITATGGLTVIGGSQTFNSSNWDDERTITIRASDDDNGVPETAAISFAITGGDYDSEMEPDIPVKILDDDTPDLTITPLSLTDVDEGSTTGKTYTIKPTTEPSAEFTVNLSSDNDVVEVSPEEITFNAGNWQTAQTVRVTALQDDDAFDDTATITHTTAMTEGDHLEYHQLTGLDSVSVTADDDDEPEANASLTSLRTQQRDGRDRAKIGNRKL